MTLSLCEDKALWQDQCERVGNREFLQSWEWGQFQEETGKKPLRIFIASIEGTVPFQGFITRLPVGLSYLYCPRTVAVSADQVEVIRAYGQTQGFAFIRVEPAEITDVPRDAVVRDSLQPQQTMRVDLTLELVDLLGQMHAKTRYNIHLATKKGVIVREQKDVDIFWKLNTETTERDKFRSHGKSYYAAMLKLEMAHQLIAYIGDVPAASVILIAYGDTMTYAHGASSSAHRNLMAPYALQWAGMKLGKQLGKQWYDFGGVAPIAVDEDKEETKETFHHFAWNKQHRWNGITKFKAGFGGAYRAYPRAFDLPCRLGRFRFYRCMQMVRHYLPF